VSHILAISGMNLSLMMLIVWGLALFLPMPRFLKVGLAAAIMWGYVWVIVFPVSAVRAAWFWTFALLALSSGSLVGLPAIFLLAVLVMVSVSPQVVWDIGFQLSVSAVAGMWLATFMTRGRGPGWLPKWIWFTALATLGATVTTWPIVAYHFGIVSFVSLFANVLIVPAVAPFMVLSLLALPAGALNPLVGSVLSFPIHLLWVWMTGVARVLAHVPGAAMMDVYLPRWFLPVYYLAGFALVILILKHQHRNWREMWE